MKREKKEGRERDEGMEGGASHRARVHKAQQASPAKTRAEHPSLDPPTDDKLLR